MQRNLNFSCIKSLYVICIFKISEAFFLNKHNIASKFNRIDQMMKEGDYKKLKWRCLFFWYTMIKLYSLVQFFMVQSSVQSSFWTQQLRCTGLAYLASFHKALAQGTLFLPKLRKKITFYIFKQVAHILLNLNKFKVHYSWLYCILLYLMDSLKSSITQISYESHYPIF